MSSPDLAHVSWRLERYAGYWLPDEELAAVVAWMKRNHLRRATAEREVVVANNTITYGQDRAPDHIRSPHREIVMVTVPLWTAPPTVRQPRCTEEELAELLAVFEAHEWSSGFDGVCASCSRVRVDEHGVTWCHRDNAMPWPCPPVQAALDKAGLPVAPPANRYRPPRVLGDCLDPVDNAKVFGF